MKRLVVFCDGTWQDLDRNVPTNVVKLAQAISPQDQAGIHQVVYYDEGLGTKTGEKRQPLSNFLLRLEGGAFGLGIDFKILEAYYFLSLNYVPGDEIYLFGFSRGAYTVRSLAGLIYNCGLLKREKIRYGEEAYEIYRDRDQDDLKPWGSKAIAFREAHSRTVPITVLGCWDTVGAPGIPDLSGWINLDTHFNDRYQFHDTELNHTIGHAFHAVAIDEIRKLFEVTEMTAHHPNQSTQTWFVGDHSSVGGGKGDVVGLADITLQWMLEQVRPLGLACDSQLIEGGIQTNPLTPFDNTPQPPFNQLGRSERRPPNQLEAFHPTVRQRWQSSEANYHPENLRHMSSLFEA